MMGKKHKKKIPEKLLFYSNHCAHSRRIVTLIHKMQLQEKIAFINIDSRNRDPNLKTIINRFLIYGVPTIVVRYQNRPYQPDRYAGSDAFFWVESFPQYTWHNKFLNSKRRLLLNY